MRTEKVVASIFLLGLTFKFFNLAGAGPILILSLMLLSIMYFPLAFYFFCDKKIKNQNQILSIISGMVLAVVPVGLLFKLMYWPGGNNELLMGILTVPIILGVVLYKKNKNEEGLKVYYKNLLLRISILLALNVIFYFIPTETLIKIQERRDPEMGRLKVQSYTNPENEEYAHQLDVYLAKSDSLFINEIMQEDSLLKNEKK